MRRSGPLALAVLLAACTVTTTGAPCSSDANCPSDQGCGSDRACSPEALACPGHGAAGECVPGVSCSPGGGLATCTSTGGVCSTVAVSPCPDPGQSCTASGGNAACACPTAGACPAAGATRCSPAGAAVERCLPVVAGSACLAWQAETDCGASGFVCSGSACACPPAAGPAVVADAVSGSPLSAVPRPTGAASPPACRFARLGDALSEAGPGGTVRAVGRVPGGAAVVFVEAGALAVPAGATLTTDDATPDPSHYAVTTAAAIGGTFLALGPGATLSGFEVRNGASSGTAVQASCPLASDTARVALDGVRIAASTGGATPVRFGAGLRVDGYCGATASGLSVDGAATGLVAEPRSPAVTVTASAPRITGATVAAASIVDGAVTFTGGLVESGAAGVQVGVAGAGAPSFAASGTTFSGIAGDALQVARGSAVADACTFQGNGTHVHAQPSAGAAVSLTVRDSATMTGATNSALRLLALGSGSTLVLTGNAIRGNGATQDYMVATGLRRGGGIVFTAPFPGTVTFRGNVVAGNGWDQVLVAASTGTLDLRGVASCASATPAVENTFKCYDAANGGVGLYSNGASVAVDGNRWTNQPAVLGIDFAGTGVSGENAACALDRTCP